MITTDVDIGQLGLSTREETGHALIPTCVLSEHNSGKQHLEDHYLDPQGVLTSSITDIGISI